MGELGACWEPPSVDCNPQLTFEGGSGLGRKGSAGPSCSVSPAAPRPVHSEAPGGGSAAGSGAVGLPGLLACGTSGISTCPASMPVAWRFEGGCREKSQCCVCPLHPPPPRSPCLRPEACFWGRGQQQVAHSGMPAGGPEEHACPCPCPCPCPSAPEGKGGWRDTFPRSRCSSLSPET